ncbi:MAG: bifunctional metallophosphatase/5'-nucleotidase [Prevotellaceae bacterium]|jgi:5'-nucleotidase|nr:bifunctional metallophosphatase/5'-nucleotidase [Prevotellaceae bacterium]
MKKSLLIRSATLYFAVVSIVTASAQTKEITILAVNDMHASIDRFPKFVALVDSMRTAHPNLLLFSAGDNRTGNPVNDMYPQPSHPMTALMNRAGFNLSVIGNHEFDGGVDGLRYVLNHSNFRYVCANFYAPDSLRLHIEPYKIFEIEGVKIAVLGLIQRGEGGLPEAHPNKMTNMKFYSPLEVAIQYGWLRYFCDIFIVLAHEGYEESIGIVNQYPFADLLISGHTHYVTKDTEIHNNVLITQADAKLKYVTHITLQLTDGKVTKKEARALSVDAFSQKDHEVELMVNTFNNSESLHRVLTQAITDFSNYEELGCMMTDAIRIETGADIAFQNPGGVRFGAFSKGPFTVKDVYQLDPFGNEVIQYNLTGEEVLRLIAAAYIADNGAAYVSGITYRIELDNQKQIKNIEVTMADGSPINLQNTYKVVMNSYLAAVSQYEKSDKGRGLYRTTADATIEYLEKQQSVDYAGVNRVIINN